MMAKNIVSRYLIYTMIYKYEDTLSFITKVNDLKPKKKFKYVLNECLKFERFGTAFKKKKFTFTIF